MGRAELGWLDGDNNGRLTLGRPIWAHCAHRWSGRRHSPALAADLSAR